MSKFKNKYRIESTRLKYQDYSTQGAYFVTIVSCNRKNIFGEIKNNKIILNDSGKNVYQCWLQIPEHFPIIVLDEFIIMPNLIDRIIFIIENAMTNNKNTVETQNFGSLRKPKNQNQSQINSSVNKFGPQSKNLGSIIPGFKIRVEIWYREQGIDQKIWQSRFHDHIIRNEKELKRIRHYIINNPLNWEKDEHNK